MTPSFFIAKSFVTKIAFDVTDSVQLTHKHIFPTETNLRVEIAIKNSENNMYHLVEIQIGISSVASENTPVYNLVMNYASIIGTPEVISDETELNEILKRQVPRILLDNIRSIVYQVTRDAGFPFMMRDDTFDNPIQNDEAKSSMPSNNGGICDFIDAHNQDTPNLPESEKIDFQWMINFDWANDDPELLEAVQDFWAIYSSNLAEDTFVDYESLPIYKCYYRFFTPIKYLHPDFKECDDSIWPILFQMLYGSFQSECEVIDNKYGLPEIKFTYYDDGERTKCVFMDRTISSLTLEELKELLSDLITEALSNISVGLLEFRNAGIMSEEHLQDIQLWSEQDFYRLFDASVSDEGISLLNTMYKKIDVCSNQTRLYPSYYGL